MRCPQKEILQAFLITAPKRIREGEGQMGVGKGKEKKFCWIKTASEHLRLKTQKLRSDSGVQIL